MDQEQLQQIRRLLALVDRYALAELVVQEEGLTVTIRGVAAGPVAGVAEPALHAGESEIVAAAPDGAVDEESEEEEELHRLYSPMTGIFYHSPSPEERAYVKAGDAVEEGQTVGLIEAMKVFSEIPADVSGRVVRVCVETGKIVSQGEVLMLIDLDAHVG
jgi:acetyl-CoA carboxylase biotin carboxyl carrier protein